MTRRTPVSLALAALSVPGIIATASAQQQTTFALEGDLGALVAQVGHIEPVTALAISPDGKQLASASAYNDGAILVWDRGSGDITLRLDGERSVSYSPDGRWIAGIHRHGSARIWDARSGALVHELRAEGPVAFLPSGDLLVGVEDADGASGQLAVLDLGGLPDAAPRKRGALVGHDSAVTAWATSAEGDLLYTGSYSGDIKIWDLAGRALRRTLTKSREPVVALAPLKGRSDFAVAFRGDKAITVFDRDGDVVTSLEGHSEAISDIALIDRAHLVSSARGGETIVWRGAKAARTIGAHSGVIGRGGKGLWVGSRALVELGVQTGKAGRRLEAPPHRVDQIAFSADGKSLVTISLGGELALWDWSARKLTRRRSFPNTRRADGRWSGLYVLSPDGRWVVWHPWHQQGDAKRRSTLVYDAAKGKRVATLRALADGTDQVVFAQAGDHLATLEHQGNQTNVLAIWALPSGKKVDQTGLRGWHRLAGFADKDQALAIFDESSQRTQLRLWSRRTGLIAKRSLARLGARYRSQAFVSSAALTLAYADSKDRLVLRDLKGKATLGRSGSLGQPVRRLTVDAVGKRVAALDARGTIHVVDVAAKTTLARWSEHTGYGAEAMAFSPDGALLAVGRQGWVEVLEIATGRWYRLIDLGQGWAIHDHRGRFSCSRRGCDLLRYRSATGELLKVEDKRVRALKGL